MTAKLAPPGKLSPPSTGLFPPPGKLLPPVFSPGASFAALPEDMAALAERAAILAKRASSKASELAAQHGPAVKQAALILSASASDYAKKAAHGAAEVVKSEQIKLSDPEYRQRKAKGFWKVTAILAGAIIIVGGSGWLYAKRQATIIAKSEIDNLIGSNGLASYISYQSISASPFGSATLYGVTFSDGGAETVTVDAVGLSNITKSGGQVTGVTISFDGFDVPALKILRSDYGSSNFGYQWNTPNVLMEFLMFGYTDVKGSVAFSAHPSGDNRYNLQCSGSIDDAGSWSINTDFGNTPETPGAIQGLISSGGIFGLLSALQALTNVNLVDATLTINDKKFQERSNSLTGKASPYDAEELLFGLPDEHVMTRDGMSSDAADQVIKTLTNWQNKGGELTVRTNLAQPLPLMTTGPNSIWGQGDSTATISSIEDFLAKTNAQVSF